MITKTSYFGTWLVTVFFAIGLQLDFHFLSFLPLHLFLHSHECITALANYVIGLFLKRVPESLPRVNVDQGS
jgi:hypothetical protein